ncbi:MAG: hypothetical protein M1828_005366 [Chrysothrix sp. TS-e1954]|nr:MAG: hypothetical protein M1828_005366 [Chrysothrix sp. TS-e1954]
MAMKYFRRSQKPSERIDDSAQTSSPYDSHPTVESSHVEGMSISKPVSPEAKHEPSVETLDTTKLDENDASVLSEEDEAFLQRIASNADAPLPSLDQMSFEEEHIPSAAFLTPLPTSPAEEIENVLEDQSHDKPSKSWSYKSLVPSTTFPTFGKSKDNKDSETSPAESKEEAARETRDISSVLSGLNLATLNNRVVSLSDDSKKLVHQFNLILRDIVNGVPTAYDDLEKFLTQRQGQIEKLYKTMPPFVQALIVGLPARMLAASKSKGATGAQSTQANQQPSKGKPTKKKTSYIPTLRNLVAQKGAIAGMLQSTVTFLETRFPMVLAGTNVLMSLAVFILMFVFWYCHKRGKETRLAKEDSDTVDMEDTTKPATAKDDDLMAQDETPAPAPTVD